MTSLVTSQPIPGVRPRVVHSAAGPTAAPETFRTSPPEPEPITSKVISITGQSENSLIVSDQSKQRSV